MADATQSSILQVGTSGVVFTEIVTDPAMISTHSVTFEAYLIDLDDTAIVPKSLELTLTIEIVDGAESVTDLIAESLLRQEPICLDTFSSVYEYFFDETAFI